MLQSFKERFDIKRFKIVTQLILILACGFLIVNLAGKTLSRYEARVDVSAEASVAFFLLNQGTYESTISLTGLTPSPNPFYYTFYVTNNKDGKRTDVNLNYTIKFETTTNLPLTYEIVRNETFEGNYTNIITSTSTRQDSDDVFYNVYTNNNTYSFTHNSNQTDSYILKVNFPESNKNKPDKYQGVIELFTVIIDATQVA